MWIANLSNGQTITEQEMDWDDLPLEEITCLHLVGQSVAFIRARPGYQFFQYKARSLLLNPATGAVSKTPVQWQRIGAVVNKQGDCIYIQMEPSGQIDVRFDNVLDMKLNLSLLRIHLSPEIISQKQRDGSHGGILP